MSNQHKNYMCDPQKEFEKFCEKQVKVYICASCKKQVPLNEIQVSFNDTYDLHSFEKFSNNYSGFGDDLKAALVSFEDKAKKMYCKECANAFLQKNKQFSILKFLRKILSKLRLTKI